jgi:hypothetical protein
MRYLKQLLIILSVFLGFWGGFISNGLAQQPQYRLIIKDHQFIPAELEIPAYQKVKIIIENQDATAEEFESYDLRREKIVSGHGKIVIYVGPLKAGKYKFFGEFHPDTAFGFIVVK